MELVWIATMAAAIGGVLVLGYKIEQAVTALRRRIDQERRQANATPRLVPLSALPLAAAGEAPAPPVRFVDVRRVGVSHADNRISPDAPYALAFLDEDGDGVLVSSREGPEEPEVTARRIRGGRTSESLADWEVAAVDDALRSLN